MSRTSVVSRATFQEVVAALDKHSDFFDPFYLTQPDWQPFTPDEVNELAHELLAEGTQVSDEEVAEVITFLQTYSDVDLTEFSNTDEDDLEELLRNWYSMYLEEKTTWPEPGDRRVR
jgi:hypothetical protein